MKQGIVKSKIIQVLDIDKSRSAYSKMEAGVRPISVEESEAIRSILKMDCADFFQKP